MHVVWGINKRNKRCVHTYGGMISLESQKHDGMAPRTGGLDKELAGWPQRPIGDQ